MKNTIQFAVLIVLAASFYYSRIDISHAYRLSIFACILLQIKPYIKDKE